MTKMKENQTNTEAHNEDVFREPLSLTKEVACLHGLLEQFQFDMREQIDHIEQRIYHLQQRLERLEQDDQPRLLSFDQSEADYLERVQNEYLTPPSQGSW